MSVNLRSRTRAVVRQEVAQAAFAVLVDRGYEAVTVDQLAREVGISRATFFRYFDSKEDVVIETAAPPERDWVQEVRELPGADQTDLGAAVLAMLERTLPAEADQTEQLRARVRMISATPDLGARLARKRGARQLQLAEALTARTGDAAFASICAAVGFACLDVAWRDWARADGATDLRGRYASVVRGAREVFLGR